MIAKHKESTRIVFKLLISNNVMEMQIIFVSGRIKPVVHLNIQKIKINVKIFLIKPNAIKDKIATGIMAVKI